jgi:uncharacterized membrane protein YheB (UPF0754 family)
MAWQLFLIPIGSAFSCWLVIKIFFTLLFRPRQPRSILGFEVQGILPKKQSTIAAQAGKIVAEQFLSLKTIEEKISDPSTLQKIMPLIEEHIDDFLRNKLKKEMPFIGMFVGDKTVSSLKKVFMTELETLFPNIMRSYASNLITDLNIERLVSQKIATASIQEVETSVRKNFSKELRLTELMSASIGLIIGLIVMLVVAYLK